MAQIFVTAAARAERLRSAVIDATAKLSNNVSIGANAVIRSGIELGDNVIIGAGCFVKQQNRCRFASLANVTIYHEIRSVNCTIGRNSGRSAALVMLTIVVTG